jgi:23S rRNA (guanosine2251-2'-O)-methyltransferase
MGSSDLDFLYGINPAYEAIKAERRSIYKAYFFNQFQKNIRLVRLKEKITSKNIPIQLCGKKELFELAKTTEHQGVILETAPYPYCNEEEFFEQSRVLLLDNVEDPQNLGAILRSAEVFGWQYVLLSSRGVPEIYPSVVKASAGATEHLKISHTHTANNFVKFFKEKGFSVVVLDTSGKTLIGDLSAISLKKTLLVIGGEHKGVGHFILQEADYVFRIAQAGKVSSLNVSVASGIALYLLGKE